MEITPLVGKQQQSVEHAIARINVWDGSVRSSKTICSLLAWLRYVRTGPAGNLVMVGKTERTLKRNIIDPLVEMLGPRRCKANWGDGELMLLGRRIYLAGANDEKAQEKIRGLTLAGAYVDEVSIIPESFWAMLLTRLSIDGAKLFGTTNPDGPTHWLLKNYLAKASLHIDLDGKLRRHDGDRRLDLHRFSFRLADNPNLPPKYVAELAKEFTGLWYLRFIEGRWVLAEGAIFDMFDPEPGGRHVVETLPVPIEQWWVAVDYGTTNPFVALLLGLGVDDRIYVAREWRWDSVDQRKQLTDATYSTHLRDWLDGLMWPPGQDRHAVERIIVDPSAASFIAQLWMDGWDGVRGANNEVLDGIRNIASLLANDRLKIHQSCTGLLDEMVGYVWDPKATEKGEEKPLKARDHGPDALRYGVADARRVWRHWLVNLDELDAR
jgi:PBSX family phage terminase large subunit